MSRIRANVSALDETMTVDEALDILSPYVNEEDSPLPLEAAEAAARIVRELIRSQHKLYATEEYQGMP